MVPVATVITDVTFIVIIIIIVIDPKILAALLLVSSAPANPVSCMKSLSYLQDSQKVSTYVTVRVT
jgi:hypothetical protein